METIPVNDEGEVIFSEVDKIWRSTKELFKNKKGNSTVPRKLSGSITCELIKETLEHHLKSQPIVISNRDVYITGVRFQLDLLIAKKSAKPKYNILYDPSDVLIVFEIKSEGSFNRDTASKVRDVFNLVSEQSKQIRCCYVTIRESSKSPNAVKTDHIKPHTVYTLVDRDTKGNKGTGDWKRLIDDIGTTIKERLASTDPY